MSLAAVRVSRLDPAVRAQTEVLSRREAMERVLARAAYLAEADRLLLEQVYRHGLSVSEVARLTGDRPRALQRRMQRLLAHLNDPLFAYVAGRLELWPREMQTVARRVVLHGQSLRDTARATGMSLHRVRKQVDAVRALARCG